MELNTRPLGERLALEVLEVDAANPEPGVVDALRRLWETHPLLFLRRQSITERELVEFSRHFGQPDILVRDDMLSPSHPEVIYVTNLLAESGRRLGGLGSYELSWHVDQIYRERPPTGSVFYAVEMPEDGPNTFWCDTQAAYEALPGEMQSELAGFRATCKYGLRENWGFQRDISDKEKLEEMHRRTPAVTHPMVLTHPVSGRRSLYFDPRKTIGIEGLAPERSEALVRELFAHAIRSEFVYKHSWRPGDIVMWDNARLMHKRDDFDGSLPRLAKRTTLHLPPDRFPTPGVSGAG